MIDISKPVKTRDGQPVTILIDKARGQYPLIGYVGESDIVRFWTADGKYYENGQESRFDLVQSNVFWVNIYPTSMFGLADIHASREKADSVAAPGRIACVRVEFVEGQFDV